MINNILTHRDNIFIIKNKTRTKQYKPALQVPALQVQIFKPSSFMVVSVGGDLPPPPTVLVLDPAMLTLSITSSLDPIAVPPSVSTVPQFDGSSTLR